MRRAVPLLALALLVSSSARAEDDGPSTAAAFTDRGRGFRRVLDVVLGAPAGDGETGRSLLLLLDATPELASAGFTADLRDALDRHRTRVRDLDIGLLVLGGSVHDRAPDRDREALLASVDAALAAGTKSFRNVYAGVREAAADLGRREGTREVLLVTLANGDGEERLAPTVAALVRRDVRLTICCGAAFLSDTYWRRYPVPSDLPRGVELHGGEAAFVEVPWGWLFQTVANEQVSSGFAPFGLSALAQGAGGRVFLHYPREGAAHACITWGTCVFCSGDHVTTRTSYRTHKLRALAPIVESRRAVYAAAARDPYFRATLDAWREASKAGVTTSRPSVRLAGSTLKPERRRDGRPASFAGFNLSSHASKAHRLADECERIAEKLHRSIERAGEGSRRYRAIAELTYVNLHVMRVNLLHLEAWCREVAETLLSRSDAPEPPEVPAYAADARYVGIGSTVQSLCHGVAPFLRQHLPGGEAMRAELRRLDGIVGPFLERHANTPFAVAITRSGLARYYPVMRGNPPRYVRPESDVDDDATTTRPERGSSAGGGTGGGTTSGGG